MMGFGGIFGIVLIAVIVWAVIQFTNKNKPGDPFKITGGNTGSEEGSALEILKKRYARGEIKRDEYQRMKEDLKQSS